jgi:hypothetical protein
MARKSPEKPRQTGRGEPAEGARGDIEHELAREEAKARERKIDDAVDMSFPASDPPASGRATGTEPPSRAPGRAAPATKKEDVERARKR